MTLIVLAWKNLRRKGLRTLLTMLGIAIGVASVVLISSVGTLGTKAVNNELDSLGLNGISVSAQADAPALDDIDLQMVRNVQQVEQAMPILTQNGVIQTFAAQQQVMLWGIDAGAKQVLSVEIFSSVPSFLLPFQLIPHMIHLLIQVHEAKSKLLLQ